MNAMKMMMMCTAFAAALTLNSWDVGAHESPYGHVHFGSTIQPDYEPFAGMWYPNIRYANAPNVDPNSQVLDVYTLDLPLTNAPVMIYVHGGGGDRGDKALSFDLGEKPAYFAAKEGFVFVSVNYRLGRDGGFPNAHQDVADAVAWIHNNIPSFGGNPNQIFLSGHSFGAGVVVQVGTNGMFLKNAGKDLSVLKGVIVIDGGGISGGEFKNDKYLPAFLFLNTGPGSNAPGGGNGLNTARATVGALRAAGHQGDVVELFGKDHFTASSDIGKYNDQTTLAVHRFLDSVLRRTDSRAVKPCCPASPSLPPRDRAR
ncbi:MAG: alpha/beta hydrolase [Acidobacteria bacterium]|nr:alpha/beta hydrolase [Acidobacteriota bacterium]